MKVMHELNQLEMGGAERVVLGIVKHDKKNEHTVYTYKDGPMRGPLEAVGAKVIVDEGDAQYDVELQVLHIHTGGEASHAASAVKGVFATVETVHSPVVSAVRDKWVDVRVGVSNVVTAKNRKCRTIYNGVDIDRLQLPEEKEKADYKELLGIPRDAVTIGRLGRVGYDKCLEEFLSAAWRVQMERPDVWIVIAGGEAKSARGYLGRVKVMAASLPLRNVVFVPETEDVAPVYAAMDIFMYPSPTEGFGLVYLEAMACQAAVVAWDSDLTRELLMGHALLAPPTVDGLVERTKYLVDKQSIREEFGTLGANLVASNFTAERMSQEYQALYEEVLETRKKTEGAEVGASV